MVPPAPERAAIGDPTLVCGFPKSGTTLLAALLDGHPDLLCFPEETWALRVASRRPREQWLEHILGSRAIERLGEGVAEGLAGRRDFRGFDLPRFRDEARALWEGSGGAPRDLMESLLEAFRRVTGRGPCRRWVEKSPEHETHLARHAADWEGLRVVHVVRDPRSVLCSFRRKRERHEEAIFADGLAVRWRAGLRAVLELESRRPGTVAIVRYEDVVRDARAALSPVCELLDVPWHDALGVPTLLGRPWGGNSMFATEMSGISDAALDRWRGEIDPRERAVLETVLAPELDALGYGERAPARFVRAAASLAREQRSGLRTRARAFLAMSRVRSAPAAAVSGPAFARAFRGAVPS